MLGTQSRVAFGTFEADLVSGELYKAGFRVKLQSQPFRVLVALLERPGEVVTREELQLRLWSKDTTVDFDHSLGTAINKLREALGDSADNPRFVETLARRGYRFIAPVIGSAPAGSSQPAIPMEVLPEPAAEELLPPQLVPPPALDLSGDLIVTPSRRAAPPSGEWLRRALAWLCILAVISTCTYFWGRRGRKTYIPEIRQVTQSGRILTASSDMESFPASVTDGFHIFASSIEDGRPALVEASVVGGRTEPLPIPDEIAGPLIAGISPDGSKLLLRSHLSNESEQPLWIVPVTGGSAQRVPNVLAHDAAWMPNGSDILFAAGDQLLVLERQSGAVHALARLPGRAFWLRWSQDGSMLRFTIFDPITHDRSLWQLAAGKSTAAPVLPAWKDHSNECCGVWTADGSSFVFQSSRGDASDLWRIAGRGTSTPERLTNGPLISQGPLAATTGHRIFFTGVNTQSAVEIYEAKSMQFKPAPALLANVNRVEFSRDGAWVAWTDLDGRLWRARPDGTGRLQLTPDSLSAFLVRWSPDGSRLAFMGRRTGQAWQVYMVQADGSDLKRVFEDPRNAGDPTWSADGRSLAFGRVPDLMGKEGGVRTIQIIDLETSAMRTLPGSEQLFSPRWSPDGRFIAAISLDQRRLMLYDTTTEHWRQLASGSFADPVWSSDSHAIYAQGFMDARQPIYRIALPTGRLEEIATLANFHADSVLDSFFCGLTPDNMPVVRARGATGNLYSLEMDSK